MHRIFLLFLLALNLGSCTYYLGPNRWAHSFNESTFLVPTAIDSSALKHNKLQVVLGEDLEKMAAKNYVYWSDKHQDTILDARKIYANLLLSKNIEQVNVDLMRFEAWGTTGTSSKLNPTGDYDFQEIIFLLIAHQFKYSPELLYPATAQHIIDVLIVDNGAKPTLKAPKVLGLIRETENHILMKETSRYLKNQWMHELYPSSELYAVQTEKMEAFLIKHLKEMKKTGFFEFNAQPYIGFTLEALHVLMNYTKNEEIKVLCKEVMDAENWQYALGSFNLNRYAPFRRRMEHAKDQELNKDRHGVFIRTELAKLNQESISSYNLPCCFDRTLIAANSAYLLPIQTAAMIEEKPSSSSYYAKIGHGIMASPELYYGNSSFLLSAGGLRYGQRSQITPRPTTLFLNDGVTNINECFHTLNSTKLKRWNNTALYKNFTVSKGQIFVPSAYALTKELNGWKVYQVNPENELFVCVRNTQDFGAIYLCEGASNLEVLAQNDNEKKLKKQFINQEGELIQYKLSRSKRWPIKKINGEKQVARFGKWKRFDVQFEPNTVGLR